MGGERGEGEGVWEPCSADSLRKKLIWCATQQGPWNLRGLGERTSRLVDKRRKGGWGERWALSRTGLQITFCKAL